MEVTGYVVEEMETATYKGDVVLIMHTKQDLPTVVVLSDDALVADLKDRQRSLLQQVWDRWCEATGTI